VKSLKLKKKNQITKKGTIEEIDQTLALDLNTIRNPKKKVYDSKNTRPKKSLLIETTSLLQPNIEQIETYHVEILSDVIVPGDISSPQFIKNDQRGRYVDQYEMVPLIEPKNIVSLTTTIANENDDATNTSDGTNITDVPEHAKDIFASKILERKPKVESCQTFTLHRETLKKSFQDYLCGGNLSEGELQESNSEEKPNTFLNLEECAVEEVLPVYFCTGDMDKTDSHDIFHNSTLDNPYEGETENIKGPCVRTEMETCDKKIVKNFLAARKKKIRHHKETKSILDINEELTNSNIAAVRVKKNIVAEQPQGFEIVDTSQDGRREINLKSRDKKKCEISVDHTIIQVNDSMDERFEELKENNMKHEKTGSDALAKSLELTRNIFPETQTKVKCSNTLYIENNPRYSISPLKSRSTKSDSFSSMSPANHNKIQISKSLSSGKGTKRQRSLLKIFRSRNRSLPTTVTDAGIHFSSCSMKNIINERKKGQDKMKGKDDNTNAMKQISDYSHKKDLAFKRSYQGHISSEVDFKCKDQNTNVGKNLNSQGKSNYGTAKSPVTLRNYSKSVTVTPNSSDKKHRRHHSNGSRSESSVIHLVKSYDSYLSPAYTQSFDSVYTYDAGDCMSMEEAVGDTLSEATSLVSGKMTQAVRGLDVGTSSLFSINATIDDMWLAKIVLSRYADSKGLTVDELIDDVCDKMDAIDKAVFRAK